MNQTNRSILFEVINPEKADLLTFLSDVSSKESLSDDKLKEIHGNLAVSSFEEFLEKFSPTVNMLLQTNDKKVVFSLDSLGGGEEKLDFNHPDSLFQVLLYLIESKRQKKYLLTSFEDLLDNLIPRRDSALFFEDRNRLIAEITEDGEGGKVSGMRKLSGLLHAYDDGIYLLRAYLNNLEQILPSLSGDMVTNRGVLDDHGRLQVKVLKTAEKYRRGFFLDDQFDDITYEKMVTECLEKERETIRNGNLLRDCFLLPVYAKRRDITLLRDRYQEYSEFYAKLIKQFWITAKPLLETLLGVWNFFAPYAGYQDMKPVLVVSNFSLQALLETKNRERLEIYLNSVNAKNFRDNTIWYAILPNLVTKSELQSKNIRERFQSQRELYSFRRNGTEEVILLLEILARYKVQTFLGLSLTKENTFSAVAKDGLERINDNLSAFEKMEGKDYLIPCFPNFLVISEEEACINMGKNIVIDEHSGNVKLEGKKMLWLDEIGVEACYVAAGLIAACQCPAYLRSKYKRGVLEDTPGVAYRFSEEGHSLKTTTAMLSETIEFSDEMLREVVKHSRGVAFGQQSGKMILLTDRAFSYSHGNGLLLSMVQTLTYIERVIQYDTQDYKKTLINQFFQRRPGSVISQWYAADHSAVNAIIKEDERIEYKIEADGETCTFSMFFQNNELVRSETVAVFKE